MRIIKLIIIAIELIRIIESFCYSTSFQIASRRNLYDTIGNFMNLNENLNNKNINNNLKISKYNNNTSIIFSYDTYSLLEDYKYKNKIILKDKNTYYASYIFNIDDTKFKYLIKMVKDNRDDNRDDSRDENKRNLKFNISIKYNCNYIGYVSDMNMIIYKIIFGCINKKPTQINELLKNFFDININKK